MKDKINNFQYYDDSVLVGGKSTDAPEKVEQKKSNDDNATNIKNASQKVNGIRPIKLVKTAGVLILLGGSILVLSKISSCSIRVKEQKLEPERQQAKYETMLNNDYYRTSTFYQLIDEPTSSLDDLINKDKAQYEAYEKFRDMLRAKEQFIDPKMTNLQNYEINETVLYSDIDAKKISDLNDLYYEYYKEYIDAETANDMAGYNMYKAKFDEVCVQLISANNAITFYQEQKGNQLVMDMASKVLASKVIDTDGSIVAAGVTDIHGEYNEDGTMKVTFKYDNFGNTVSVTSSDFSNQGYDLVENLAKDIAENNNLRAIHETKILANDSNYVAPAHKK